MVFLAIDSQKGVGMNFPLLIPCIAVFVLSPAVAPDLESGVAGILNTQAILQQSAPHVELSSVTDISGMCRLDTLERFDGAEDRDAIAKEKAKAKAERKRRTDADERFGMLMLLLHILHDAK